MFANDKEALGLIQKSCEPKRCKMCSVLYLVLRKRWHTWKIIWKNLLQPSQICIPRLPKNQNLNFYKREKDRILHSLNTNKFEGRDYAGLYIY